MRIDPRVVGLSALRRWMRQALELLWRGAGFWLALSLLMCLWMFMAHRTPILGGVFEMLKVHARALLGFASIFFQFPCMTLLALPYRAAWRLSGACQIRNLAPMLGIGENQAHGPTRVAAGSLSSPLSSRA